MTLRESRQLYADELLAHARALMADYKVPERIHFVHHLPGGLTGKVDRRQLQDMLMAEADLIEEDFRASV